MIVSCSTTGVKVMPVFYWKGNRFMVAVLFWGGIIYGGGGLAVDGAA